MYNNVNTCVAVHLLAFGLVIVLSIMADAQDQPEPTSYPNLKMSTFGGKQLWTDYCWRQGWRVQKNALTGHWRLLDAKQVRHAWGSREACQLTLDKLQIDSTVPGDRLVVLLHGLMRSSTSMSGLGDYLTREHGKSVAYFEYASTRAGIGEHAAALSELVADLPASVRISFVGHSMGNIVVRHALADWERDGAQETLARIESVIMLGPPNQGSSIARQLSKTGVFGWVTGQGGMELGDQWSELEKRLAIPTCPFGIIAGRLPDTNFQNPLVDGEGDFIVSLEETKLPGATAFMEVPRLHSFLMDDSRVQQAVAEFLDHQHF